jgi:hypothetical protein
MKITEYLPKQGWKEWPDAFKKYGKSYFKRFPTPTRCHLNKDKEGIQVQIVVSEWEGKENHEVFLQGELKDGTWFNFHQHGLKTIRHSITKVIPRMIACWEFANSIK